MTLDILRQRLHNQLLSQTKYTQPSQVVEWLGAVQAQDYAGAKWALALRLAGITDSVIEQAFAAGSILRTHVMRPTWHFVTPADIRWMLMLTAPRVYRASAFIYRQQGLEQAALKAGSAALEKALQGGKELTRAELAPILQKAGFATGGIRLTYFLMYAELEGLICSGARRGKQFTYALLEERSPHAKTLEREEAVVELTKRYFRSHGPATLQDFVWWSGLTIADARSGTEAIKSELEREVVAEQTYWFSAATPVKPPSPTVYLLPDFDEYEVGYTDRRAIFDVAHSDKLDARGSILNQYAILIDGQVVGTWKRTIKKNEVLIELSPFQPLKKVEDQAVRAAVQQYGQFLGLPVVLA